MTGCLAKTVGKNVEGSDLGLVQGPLPVYALRD
jgi:hypothetical protein